MTRIVVSGLGIVSPAGCDTESFWQALLAGNGLGAAGAFEAIATVMAIENGIAPPTAHFDAPDPECDIDCVPNQARAMPIPAAMSNSFAFGGLNTALIFKALQ